MKDMYYYYKRTPVSCGHYIDNIHIKFSDAGWYYGKVNYVRSLIMDGSVCYTTEKIFMEEWFRMSNSIDTKRAIADAIMQLMLTKSIDDISIQEIADACGITRRSFYNHFTDKYSLIDWIYKTEAVDYISLVGEDCSWYDAVITKLNIIRNNPQFYKKVYRQEWFLNSFANITKQLYRTAVHKKGAGPEIDFEVDFYCYACVKKTGEWVTGGLKETPEALIASFVSCLPPHLARYLLDEEDCKKLSYNAKKVE
jgi:hypothetical protein